MSQLSLFVRNVLTLLMAAVALLGSLPRGAAAADPPIVLYATQEDNEIVWYRKASPPYGSWQGPKRVTDTSIQSYFKDIFTIGSDSGYPHLGVFTNDGNLLYYRDWTPKSGAAPLWSEYASLYHPVYTPSEIPTYLSDSRRFSGGEGVLYAIRTDGALLWHSMDGYSQSWCNWIVGGLQVGWGWHTFKDVFSTGKGQIYAVRTDGALLLYQHLDYKTGGSRWAAPRIVGYGWHQFKQIIPVSDGVMLAITYDGRLLWYKHLGRIVDPRGAYREVWEGPVTIGYGWHTFKNVIAANA